MDEFAKILEHLKEKFQLGGGDIRDIPPLVLAYIGDTVYHLYVRTMLVYNSTGKTVNNLHKESIAHVRASAQAKIAWKIKNKLSDIEQNILRRGRNAHSGTIPKNASVADYRMATGFEALIGYIYLNGDMERLEEIMDMSVEAIREEDI